MYGQMTAGSWIYIGTQGILQGTYETFAAAGPEALRRRPGRPARADRRPRRHGRRAAAGRHHERRRRALRGGRPAPHRAASGDRVRRRRRRLAGRGAEARRRGDGGEEAALHRPARQRRRRLPRAGAPRRHARPGHRPDVGARHAQRLRAQRHDARRGARAARARTRRSTCAAPCASIVVHVEAMLALQKAGANTFDYGNNIRGEAKAAGYADAFAFPGFVPGLHPPAVLRAATGRSAGWRSPATRRTSPSPTPPCSRPSPTTRWSRAGSRWPARRSTSRACPAASAGSGTASAPRPGVIFNDLVRTGKVKAPIVIGRDHLDSGSVAQPVPRDREHDGRQRRHRRLADPQRAAQHGRGRELGELPPRRRRGHRQEPARRHGRGRRRHRHDGRAPAPRAHHRPRHRRHAPRRRRVPGGHREGARGGHRPARWWRPTDGRSGHGWTSASARPAASASSSARQGLRPRQARATRSSRGRTTCSQCLLCELHCPDFAIEVRRRERKSKGPGPKAHRPTSRAALTQAELIAASSGAPASPRTSAATTGRSEMTTPTSRPRRAEPSLLQGNEAVAEGAIAAGARFFAGYPITPSTEIAEVLSRRLPQVGGTLRPDGGRDRRPSPPCAAPRWPAPRRSPPPPAPASASCRR